MLPWGNHLPGTSSSAAGLTTDVSVCVVPFVGGVLNSLFSWGAAAPRFTTDADGTVCAPPGAAYIIEVSIREVSGPSSATGPVRVVRASIDGIEVNEQLVMRPPRAKGKLVGWLEDATGAKRIKFTFPACAATTATIQVGVWSATPLASEQSGRGKGKDSATRPPASARGEVFSGPVVTDARYAVGDPVGVASVRLRAV